MNYKLEYITRLFQKTSGKAIESYVLSRLWHRLDNDEIKIIPQQYVSRQNEKYALTDVYFPQVQIHVEVNESAHYDSLERIEADQQRRLEIETGTGHLVYSIDCRRSLVEIHSDVDEIVDKINEKLFTLKESGEFKPWNPDVERSPHFWKGRQFFSVQDEVSLNNIEDICTLFDADFKKTRRGFLRRGAIEYPMDSGILLWWPSETTRQGWQNALIDDEQSILESHTDPFKKMSHYNAHFGSKQLRCAFFRHRDILGITSYRFKGVFAFDTERSSPETGIVWRRVSEEFRLVSA